MPYSTIDTKGNIAPMPKAPSATRNKCSLRRIRVRMACSRPREYNAKATRSQMTLISAMGGTEASSYIAQYIARQHRWNLRARRLGRPLQSAAKYAGMMGGGFQHD